MTTRSALPRSFLFLLLTVSAGASDAASPHATFTRLFTPILGERKCTIREWDGRSRKPVWQATQKRRFERTLNGFFVTETALIAAEDGRDVVGGLHLFSFDGESGELRESGYWAPAAGRLFEVEAKLDADGRTFRGEMIIATDAGTERRRIELAMSDELTFRVYKRDDRGVEYLHEELRYTR